MDLDPANIAAHFGLMPGTEVIRLRLFPLRSDTERVILVTDAEQTPLTLEDLSFTFRRSVEVHRVDAGPAFEAALTFAATKGGVADGTTWTASCDERFRQRCPLNWFALAPTEHMEVRHCAVCDRAVHLAADAEAARFLAQAGHCTAFAEVGEPDYLMGDLAPDFEEDGGDGDGE